MKKINLAIALLYLFLINGIHFVGAQSALQDTTRGEMDSQVKHFNDTANFAPSSNVGSVMAVAVRAFLGLLGIIFLILIIYGGYNWMLARGEEEKVNKAKDTIQRALIGLIIIISAYAITYFVFKNLGGVGGTGGESVPIPH